MFLVGALWQVVYLDDGERGEDDLLHAAEILIPDHLGLLPPAEHFRTWNTVKHLRHLENNVSEIWTETRNCKR